MTSKPGEKRKCHRRRDAKRHDWRLYLSAFDFHLSSPWPERKILIPVQVLTRECHSFQYVSYVTIFVKKKKIHGLIGMSASFYLLHLSELGYLTATISWLYINLGRETEWRRRDGCRFQAVIRTRIQCQPKSLSAIHLHRVVLQSKSKPIG